MNNLLQRSKQDSQKLRYSWHQSVSVLLTRLLLCLSLTSGEFSVSHQNAKYEGEQAKLCLGDKNIKKTSLVKTQIHISHMEEYNLQEYNIIF